MENAARLDPRDPTLQAGLGYMLAEGGRLQEAAEAYQNAIKLRPDDVDSHLAAALLMGQLGRDEEAIKAFRRVLQSSPDAPSAHRGLGMAYKKTGRFKDAVDPLRRASRPPRPAGAGALEQRAGRVQVAQAAEPPAGGQALRPHQRVGAAEPSAGRHRGV